MQDKITIWSSVVVSRLPETRMCQHKSEFTAAVRYKRVQDIRVRISAHQVKNVGQAAELRADVEALFILEDTQGNLHPISRHDEIRERIPLSDFWPRLDDGKAVNYIAEISNFYGDAVLQGQNLIIIYYMTYMVLAVREQMVALQLENAGEAQDSRSSSAPGPLQENAPTVNPLLAENIFLRRQLKLYETNLLGLKKSLQKAEQNNAALLRQIQLLQSGPAEKNPTRGEKQIRRPEQQTKTMAEIIPIPTQEERLQRMGRKIKEFFINNA